MQIFNSAAVYIQKIWRAFITRKVLAAYLQKVCEQDPEVQEIALYAYQLNIVLPWQEEMLQIKVQQMEEMNEVSQEDQESNKSEEPKKQSKLSKQQNSA